MSRHRGAGFTFWLRGPADNPWVEVVGHRDGSGQPADFSERAQRSIMRELLGHDGSQSLDVADGRWLLPGAPP